MATATVVEREKSGELVQLKARVPADLRWAVKEYAVTHRMTMGELMQRAFQPYADAVKVSPVVKPDATATISAMA